MTKEEETTFHLGQTVGAAQLGENVWHCVNAAIQAIQTGDEMQALGILRSLKFMVATSTARDMKEEPEGCIG